ncbi:MAG: hypothetical protein ACT4ON_11090 [Bacteroidota bacterium]
MNTQKQLFRIFNDIFSNDEAAVNEAVADAKRAFTYIRQDVLYQNNNFLEEEL